MKTTLIVISFGLALFCGAFAASPQEEARFIAEAQKALNAKDINAFLKLHYLEGIPAPDKQAHVEALDWLIEPPVSRIALAEPKPEQKTEKTHNGVTYRTTLPIVQMLQIEFKAPPGEHKKVNFSVGEKDGKLFITIAAPSK